VSLRTKTQCVPSIRHLQFELSDCQQGRCPSRVARERAAQKKIVFVYRNVFQKRLLAEIAQGGTVPTEFLYGMDQIDRTRFDVDYVIAPRGQRRTVAAWLGWFLEKPFARIVKVGMPIEVYPMFRRQIDSADVVLCANDAVSFGILFWEVAGLGKGRRCCAATRSTRAGQVSGTSQSDSLVYPKAPHDASHVFTVSDNGHEPLSAELGVPRARITTFHFGVTQEFWKPAAVPVAGTYVLSVGNDMYRDYETLIERRRSARIDRGHETSNQFSGTAAPPSETIE